MWRDQDHSPPPYNYSILICVRLNLIEPPKNCQCAIKNLLSINVKILLQTAAYKQLHEPTACGFCRKLDMNADVHHEYTELSYEYYNIPTLLGLRTYTRVLLAWIGPYLRQLTPSSATLCCL